LGEYQYYEFLAVDRPLDEADRGALRAISTRARITTTSFTNSYEWGDFKGNPAELMERWFDLHLYMANWGTRRLMLRLPERLINQKRLRDFLRPVHWAGLTESGANLILDIFCDEEASDDDWNDGSDCLAALAPLREDVLSGDLRLFYLLWLAAVENDAVAAEAPEPLPGLGPTTLALDAFAEFFHIDPDLVAAAAERPVGAAGAQTLAPDAVQRFVAGLPDREKAELLARLAQGDPHVGSELKARVRTGEASETLASLAPRTAQELRDRAHAIGEARRQKEEQRLAAKRKREAAEQERARRKRLDALLERGSEAWGDVETEIERRNAQGYVAAIQLLLDLQAIADEEDTAEDFRRRLDSIRERHVRKLRFIERLAVL
jgi:hypothetical protein